MPRTSNKAIQDETQGMSRYQTPAQAPNPYHLRPATWTESYIGVPGEFRSHSEHYQPMTEEENESRIPNREIKEEEQGGQPPNQEDNGTQSPQPTNKRGNTSIVEIIHTEGATNNNGRRDDPRTLEEPAELPTPTGLLIDNIWQLHYIEDKKRQDYILQQAKDIAREAYEAAGIKSYEGTETYRKVLITNIGRLSAIYVQMRREKASNASTPVNQLRSRFEQGQDIDAKVAPIIRQPQPSHPTTSMLQWEQISIDMNERNRYTIEEKGKGKEISPGQGYETKREPGIMELASAKIFAPRQPDEESTVYQRRQAAQYRLQTGPQAGRQYTMVEDHESSANQSSTDTDEEYNTKRRNRRKKRTFTKTRNQTDIMTPQVNTMERMDNQAVRFADETIHMGTTKTEHIQNRPPTGHKIPPFQLNDSKLTYRATPPHIFRTQDQRIRSPMTDWNPMKETTPPATGSRNYLNNRDNGWQPTTTMGNRETSDRRTASYGQYTFKSYQPIVETAEQGASAAQGIQPPHTNNRGYSIVPEAQFPHTPGIKDSIELHRERMHNWLRDIIYENIGSSIPLPEGYKPGQIKAAEECGIIPYSGNPRFSELERFITAMCIDFILKGLAGPEPEKERFRLLHLTNYLKGEADKFIMKQVMSPSSQRRDWTFEKVAIALYDRFIHYTSTHEARDNFRQSRYNPREGVQGFYDNIIDHATNMTQVPDDFTLVDHFIRNIPREMQDHLLLTVGLESEICSLEECVSHALAYENRRKRNAHYLPKSGETHSPRTDPTSRNHNDNVNQKTQKENPKERKEWRNNRPNRPSPLRQSINEQKDLNKTTGKSRERLENTGRKEEPSTKTRDDHRRGEEGERKEKKEGRCWHCNGNHFRSECPHLPKEAKLKMARSDDGQEEHEGASEREDEGLREMRSEQDDDETQTDDNSGDYGTVEMEIERPYYEDSGASDIEFSKALYVMSPQEPEHQEKYIKQCKRITLERASNEKITRPQQPAKHKQCLATLVKVGELEAWALWDSGSTTTGITPSFAHVAKIRVNELLDPHILQLGTVGSHSSIKFGTTINIELGQTKMKTYIDIINFDRYDMIIGTPFMRDHNVTLDLTNNTVIINGKKIPAMTLKEESDARIRRYRTTERAQQ